MSIIDIADIFAASNDVADELAALEERARIEALLVEVAA